MTFESRENTAVIADSLAVRISDVMNKVGMISSSMKYVTNQPFFCSSMEKSEPIWVRLEELKLEGKNASVAHTLIERSYEAC